MPARAICPRHAQQDNTCKTAWNASARRHSCKQECGARKVCANSMADGQNTTQWLEAVVTGAVVLYGGPQLCHTTQLNSRPTMPNTNWPQFLQVYIQVWVPVGAAWCTCARKESSPCKLQLCIGCIQIGPCRHGHAMHVSQASTQHDAAVHRHTSHQATLATDQHQNKGAQVQPASGYQQGHPSHHTSRPHAVLNPFT
jgi:hypothetical protein